MKKRSGFTLVELIVVIVIIGILSAVLIPSLTGYIDKAKYAKAEVEMHYVLQATENLVNDLNSGAVKITISQDIYNFTYPGTITNTKFKKVKNQFIRTYFNEFFEIDPTKVAIFIYKDNKDNHYEISEIFYLTSNKTGIKYKDGIYNDFHKDHKFNDTKHFFAPHMLDKDEKTKQEMAKI